MSKASPELEPIKAAATARGIHFKTIRRMIERGDITGYRDERQARGPIFIDPAELDAALQPKFKPIEPGTFVA